MNSNNNHNHNETQIVSDAVSRDVNATIDATRNQLAEKAQFETELRSMEQRAYMLATRAGLAKFESEVILGVLQSIQSQRISLEELQSRVTGPSRQFLALQIAKLDTQVAQVLEQSGAKRDDAITAVQELSQVVEESEQTEKLYKRQGSKFVPVNGEQ